MPHVIPSVGKYFIWPLLLIGFCCGQQLVYADPLSASLRTQFTQPDAVLQELTHDWTNLERFYALRHYAPAWTNMRGPNQRASILRQVLNVSDEEGLTPANFHLSAIESSWHRLRPSDLASLDILLSDAFFQYAREVRLGRVTPFEVDPEWHIAPVDVNPVKLLQTLLAKKDFEVALRSLPPQQSGYQRLREALARYRKLAAHGGWTALLPGPNLREGMRTPRVVLLRERLQRESLLPTGQVGDTALFDPAVTFAVERFQVLHGLKMDGVVGKETLAAMNVPVEKRITQIKLNMERWRWLPHKLGERYLIVNTAGYELTAFEHEQPRFSMWVVIGKRDRQTPELSGALHTVVFNPYWTVPTTIAIEDVIPAQIRNPKYLQSKKIRVFSNLTHHIEVNPRKVNWKQYNKANFPYVLRQDPGPYNPLGRLKFLFSNQFDVYLHDTPTRQLFVKKQRTFSSGCIRVEAPLQLADFVLANNHNWDAKRIRKGVESGQTREVKLAKSVPIYLLYLTAWVGPDEAVYFYRDVYARDQVIAECVSANSRGTHCWP